MELIISPSGEGRCLYSEQIDLAALGELEIHRASHLEPDESGQWWADLSPVDGPTLGPFTRRSVALEAECQWLGHWLCVMNENLTFTRRLHAGVAVGVRGISAAGDDRLLGPVAGVGGEPAGRTGGPEKGGDR